MYTVHPFMTMCVSIIEDDDYQLVKDVYIEEVRKLTNYLNDPRVSTQHGVKGESHDTVILQLLRWLNNIIQRVLLLKTSQEWRTCIKVRSKMKF